MAVYDTKCLGCGVVQLDVVHSPQELPPPCASCGGATEHVWLTTPRPSFFHKGWYEHLAPDPIHFDDRGKLREYCKRNGLIMEQLE